MQQAVSVPRKQEVNSPGPPRVTGKLCLPVPSAGSLAGCTRIADGHEKEKLAWPGGLFHVAFQVSGGGGCKFQPC